MGIETEDASVLLLRLTNPPGTVCCGCVVVGGYVQRAAPVIRYTLSWDIRRLRTYFARRQWKVAEVSQAPRPIR